MKKLEKLNNKLFSKKVLGNEMLNSTKGGQTCDNNCSYSDDTLVKTGGTWDYQSGGDQDDCLPIKPKVFGAA